MTDSPDDRSALARAIDLANTVIAICVEMVLPVLGGYWLDRRLGITGPFAILGGAVGMTLGVWSLIRLAQPPHKSQDEPPKRHEDH